MKIETMFKKAMQIENENLRLLKLEIICMKAMPQSLIWWRAKREAEKLRDKGAKYW